MSAKRFIVCATAAFMAAVASADMVTNKWTDGTVHDSIFNAVSWGNVNSWDPPGVPNGQNVVAWLPNRTHYVTNASPLSLYSLQNIEGPSSNLRFVYVSDEPVSFYTKATATYRVGGGSFYAPVRFESGEAYLGLVDFCGDVVCTGSNGGPFPHIQIVNFRFDRFANASGEVREARPINAAIRMYGEKFRFYAPRGLATDVTYQYALTEGSPFVRKVSADANPVIPAGTIVTGAGVPEGTFVKRIFPDYALELSRPVSAPSTSTALTFAAFTPKVHQSILSLGHNGAAIAEGAMAMKYRPEDELEVEIDTLGLSTANGAVIGFDTASGFYPGLITLHQYNASTAKNVPVEFGTCHLNFSTSASPLGPGLPHVVARQKAANSDTRLTVTNGIVAKVGCITNLIGRVTKDGAGSLEIGLFGPESRNTGTLAVEAGTLSVTSDAGLEPACVGTLAISNGATFRLPEQGLRADRLVFEPGAKIVGPGVLQLKGTHRLQGLVIADDVRIVLSDIEVEQPGSPDTVPGNPAFWVDCSKLTTLVYENVDGTNFVSRINDVRKTSDEDAYLFSTNCSGPASPWKPYLVDTAYRGNHLVCFEGSYTPATYVDGKTPPKTPDDSDTHAWSRPVHNIRAVFQVLLPFGKMNCGFLGATSAARLTEPNHQTHSGNEFARYNSNYTGNLFDWVGGSPSKVPAVANGQILVNGRETAIADGYPYKPYVPYAGGATRYVPCVMSVVMDQTAAWFPAADSYDFSPTYANQNKSGGKAMGELLVYTNELTAAQCRQVTAYLLKKWLGQDYDNDAITQTDGRTLGVLEAGLTASIGIASGASAIADSLSGAGTFSKNGEGSLFVTAMANAADASIEVNGGTLTIPSVSCTAASLVPTNAYRWYDASDPTAFTYTVDGNGVTNISAWADVRGTSGYAATIKSPSSTNRPTLRSFAALGGKTAVDFGEVRRWDKAKETDWTAAPSLTFTDSGIELYTVIAVWGSGRGGGSLVGSTASSHYWDSDYTLARDGDKNGLIGSTASASIFRTMLHPYITAFNGKAELNKRAGQFKLNGEAKNPWATGLSGSFDIVSFTDIEPFGAAAFSAVCAEQQWVGGEQFAEYLLYKRGLTRSEVAGVEAYLRKKWFNQDTPGYTSGGTEVSSVTVAAGATLRVVGGEPIRVASLSGAGTVDGKIALAEGASFEVVVDAEGACSKISVGELAVPAVATVRFVGNVRKVTPGSYVILESPTVSAGAVAGWTVTGLPPSRICTLRATDGAIVADISKSGMTVIVK